MPGQIAVEPSVILMMNRSALTHFHPQDRELDGKPEPGLLHVHVTPNSSRLPGFHFSPPSEINEDRTGALVCSVQPNRSLQPADHRTEVYGTVV